MSDQEWDVVFTPDVEWVVDDDTPDHPRPAVKPPRKCRAKARRTRNNHQHTCTGHHYVDDDCHWCPDCQTWWWNRTTNRTTNPKENRTP